MEISAFITHKKAESFSDCQDRFSINPDTKSVAVSDGMSQSFFQKIWAEILADNFVSNPQWSLCDEQCKDVLKELQAEWLRRVLDRIEEQKHDGTKENVIFRNEKFVAQGKSAGATLVGVRFVGKSWHCEVLGDSCLIEIKDGEIVQICTSQEGDEFDNFPDHLDSNPKHSGKGNAKEFEGTLENGSVLLLVSDPFSDLLNEQRRNGSVRELIGSLLALSTHEEFENLVEDWRTTKGMHNDDSTLVVIRCDGEEAFREKCIDSLEQLCKGVTVCANNLPVKVANESKDLREEFMQEFVSTFKDILCKYPGIHLWGKIRYEFVKKALNETLQVIWDKYDIIKR